MILCAVKSGVTKGKTNNDIKTITITAHKAQTRLIISSTPKTASRCQPESVCFGAASAASSIRGKARAGGASKRAAFRRQCRTGCKHPLSSGFSSANLDYNSSTQLHQLRLARQSPRLARRCRKNKRLRFYTASSPSSELLST